MLETLFLVWVVGSFSFVLLVIAIAFMAVFLE